MTALEFITRLIARGVSFSVNGDRLHVSDPGRAATPNERTLIAALKPMIRALLIQQLPDRRGEHACDGFDAAPGAALCERCAYGLPDHFWRRSGDCVFFAGAPTEGVVPALWCAATRTLERSHGLANGGVTWGTRNAGRRPSKTQAGALPSFSRAARAEP